MQEHRPHPLKMIEIWDELTPRAKEVIHAAVPMGLGAALLMRVEAVKQYVGAKEFKTFPRRLDRQTVIRTWDFLRHRLNRHIERNQ